MLSLHNPSPTLQLTLTSDSSIEQSKEGAVSRGQRLKGFFKIVQQRVRNTTNAASLQYPFTFTCERRHSVTVDELQHVDSCM